MDNRLGGIAQRAMLAADALRDRGHETVFVTPDEPGDIAETCHENGYQTYQPALRRPNNKRLWQSAKWLFSFPFCVWQMCFIIRDCKPDIVHLNGLMSLQGAVAARWCRVPVVWHLASTAYPKWLVRLLIPRIVKRAHVVSIAQGVRDYFLEGLPVTKDESIIYEPINFDAIAKATQYSDVDSFRRQFAIPADAKLFLSVGNLSARKGFDYLVESAATICAQYDDAYFAFVGGKLATQKAFVSQLEKLIAKHQLEKRVILAGERRDVFRILKEADVFVLASLDEGTPLSILEAMASRVPVVATVVGGIPDQIENGRTGLLVNPRDARHIADALAKLIDSPEETLAIAERAYRVVHEKFSMQRFLEQFLAAAERELEIRYTAE